MELRVSICSSQSPWWNSEYTYTHHRLPRGTETISILITVSLVVLRLSLYSSQSAKWYPDFPYIQHSLHGCPQTIPLDITVSFVVLRLSLYSSQSLWWHWYIRPSLQSPQSSWWYSDYPHEHHSLPGGTQTIPTLITVSLVVLRLSL